jgi:toluene monooxygenase system protein D
MSTSVGDAIKNNKVGPVMRASDVAQAAAEAAEMDNPDKTIEVDDKIAYLRISTDDELILTRASMEECLGRPFRMQEIEINLSSFAGQIKIDSEQVRFYFEKSL